MPRKNQDKENLDKEKYDNSLLNEILGDIGESSEFLLLIQKGQELILQGKREEALRILNDAIKINPNIPSPWFNIGKIYFEENNFPEAIRYCSKAVDLNHEFNPAIQLRAYAFEKLKKKGVEITEESVMNSLKEAESLIYEGEFEKVVEICNSIIERKPDSSMAWFWKGKALSALAEEEEALHCYALSNNLQNWITSFSNLIITRSVIKSQDAKKMMRLMEKEPDHTGFFPSAESWNSQGAYTQTFGKFEEALYCFEQALKINSEFKPAIKNKTRTIRLLREEGLFDT